MPFRRGTQKILLKQTHSFRSNFRSQEQADQNFEVTAATRRSLRSSIVNFSSAKWRAAGWSCNKLEGTKHFAAELEIFVCVVFFVLDLGSTKMFKVHKLACAFLFFLRFGRSLGVAFLKKKKKKNDENTNARLFTQMLASVSKKAKKKGSRNYLITFDKHLLYYYNKVKNI